MKKVISGEFLEQKMIESIELLCGVVKDSLGPKGNNVLINTSDREPFITNDGVTIAQNITSEDIVVETILEIAKEASLKTNEVVGDGTTTTLVLLETLLKEGIKVTNRKTLKVELEETLQEILEKLATFKKNPTKKDFQKIATVAANDESIGKITTEVFLKAKSKESIFLKESRDENTTYEKINGYTLECKIPEEYFFRKEKIELENCKVFFIDERIENLEQISLLVNNCIEYQEPVLLLTKGYSKNVKENLVEMSIQNQCQIILVEWFEYQNIEEEIIEDIETLLDENQTISKVKITKNKVTFHSNQNTLKRRNMLKKRYEQSNEDYQKEILAERIAKLHYGLATIYVGASTTTEKREKIMRYEDALCALEIAKQGIVPGGGICLYQISEEIKSKTTGAKILQKALSMPLKQILENAFLSKEEILTRIKQENFQILYNVKTNNFESTSNTNVIEPLEVVSYALKNAVSIACMLLSINHLIINDFQENRKSYDI